MADINPPKAGDLITEGLLARIVGRFTRFDNIRSDSPYIRITDGPNGKDLALDLPQPTRALLSGSTSPYSFTEVRDGPGGTWVSMPNGDSGTSNVYEVNGKSGLAGKVVPITWTSAGDWRFQWVGYAPPTFAWTFNVFGCAGTGLAGATIELYQSGVLIDSCTTGDGTGGTTLGRCILNVPAGTYDIVITGPAGAGFATNTSSASISATKTTNTTLTADTGAGFACWSCCNVPLPPALHSTDSDGPITLTLSFVLGNPVYSLASTTTVAETCVNAGIGVCVGCVSPSTAAKVYSIAFLANCTARLAIHYDLVQCGTGFGAFNKFTPGSGASFTSFPVVPVTTCDPINLVFTVPTTLAGTGNPGIGVPDLPMPGGGGMLAFTS